MEYFVINRKTNSIVNCITTYKPMSEISLEDMFLNGEDLYLDPNPPMNMLVKYQYWNERP